MSTAKVPAKIKVANACPRCGNEMERISKRAIDKIINILVPVRRFKCYGCLWEGNRMSSENG